MIKDILVNLSVGQGSNAACDYAVSVAARFDAHLTGVAFLYDPVAPVSVSGYMPAEIIEAQERDNIAAAQRAAKYFSDACKRAGVNGESHTLSANYGGVAKQFSLLARRFDIVIIGQAEPNAVTVDDVIGEAALFEGGRPVIIVPYIQQAPLELDQMMVCWDGSRAATRAIADAMPLLERAGRVEVLIVANERGKQDEIEGADMGAHLARYDLNVEIKRTQIGDIDVADVILSHAADMGTNFIVMGGYGHSRLREFVLGGVTRSILRSMTVPVLMSH
ncbi:MAG: universal stress protein [Hyphomicrobiales bacterium]|nr:universal stress protein [Hyphomicrobiales bacterium]